MPAEWRINFWPPCTHHVFLSHCQEDRDQLVVPVFEELERRGIIPWIDRHHYPLARDALQALREGLLACRHTAYFLTGAALSNGRGWMAVERSFADAIQRRMVYGDESAHFELPLLLVPQADPAFQRSIWRSLVDKSQSIHLPHAIPKVGKLAASRPIASDAAIPSDWTGGHVQSCADAIEKFVIQEELWASAIGDRMKQDPGMQAYYADVNLKQRILGASPQRVILPN